MATVICARLAAAHARLARGDRPALAEFDLISGLTGLGAHLWRHRPDHPLLPQILGYLVDLTEPVDGLPGWWTLQPVGRTDTETPGGHANNGMAHGITGPLSLLSLTARAGITVPGQTAAIHRICAWLDDWQQTHHGHPWWPETISLTDLRHQRTSQKEPQRPSWCYGTPGIARAQQLAGIALGDHTRRHTAEAALTGCLHDPLQLARITDHGLCHGTAGLFMTVTAFADDAITPHDLPLDQVTDLLLNGPVTDHPAPGFLTGVAGHGLALHSLARNAPPTTGWETCLLLR